MKNIDIIGHKSIQLNQLSLLSLVQTTKTVSYFSLWLETICVLIEEIYQIAKLQYEAAQERERARYRRQREQQQLLEQFYQQVFLTNTKFALLLKGFYKLAFELPPIDVFLLAAGQRALKWVKAIPEWIALNRFHSAKNTTWKIDRRQEVDFSLPSTGLRTTKFIDQKQIGIYLEWRSTKNTISATNPVIAESQLIIPDDCMLTPKHYQELLDSNIDPAIAALNFKSLSYNSAFEYLTANISFDRRNDGRITDKDMRKYSFLSAGGWWCSGIDILTMTDSLWGCFKPDTPRLDHDKNKPIKYEHPHKTPTEIFCLKVPPNIWAFIAKRYNVLLPDDYQTLPHAAFWQWVIDNNLPIILTEGAKKAACLLSLGYIAIGLPGIYSAYRTPKNEDDESISEPYLIDQLKPFATHGRLIIFGFDQDTKRKTIRNVNLAISRTAKHFLKRGCAVSILTWNNTLGKGIDDAIVNGLNFDQIYKDASSLNDWEVLQSRKLIYFERNLELNQRYLGNIPLPDQTLTAIISPKNTGKTTLLENWTNEIVHSGNKRILIISHRVILGQELGDKMGVPHLSELKHSPQGQYFGMSLNIDSLHPYCGSKFNPNDWKGAYLIIDEVVQLLRHLLFSNTCIKHRVSIIKNFKALLRTVAQSGGKIFIADADLNDVTLTLIKAYAGLDDSDIFLIENTYKFQEKWDIHTFSQPHPTALIDQLDKQLEQQKKCFVCLSSKKTLNSYSSQNLESRYRQMFPHLKILRIDADTVNEPNHPAFNCINRLNDILKHYDLVLTTSVIETGVSITVKHFDAVFGLFLGVQSTDSVRQHLSRYRPCVPRYLWTNPVSSNRIGSGSTSIRELLSAEHRKDKANISRLFLTGLEESPDGNFEPLALKTWATLAAIHNYGMWHYREQIYHDLADEGHNLTEFASSPHPSELKALDSQLKTHSRTSYDLDCQQITNSEEISNQKFEELSRKQFKTAQERLEYEKGRLQRKYLIPVTVDLIKQDHRKWGQHITLDYYLSLGRDFLFDRDKQILLSALEHGNGHYFKPDMNRVLLGNKINLLNSLNIPQLLKREEISNVDPLLIDFAHECEIKQYEIKLHLGIDISKYSTPIQRYQVIIALLGYKLPELRKQGARGQQVRIYGTAAPDFVRDKKGKVAIADGKATPVSDMRELVFDAWLKRDIATREKAIKSTLTQQQQTSLSTEDDLEINGPLCFIREFMDRLDWAGLNTFLAPISLETQKAVWERLTAEEREYLLRLQPIEPLEKVIQPLIEQIKDGSNIELSLISVNEFLATCSDEDKMNAYHLTPCDFRHLLVF
jgi:hypothetical protein